MYLNELIANSKNGSFSIYMYNLNTHTLHIEGFCAQTFSGMHLGKEHKSFATENQAIAFDGRAIGICKNCQRKREEIILDFVKKGRNMK